MLCKCLQRHYTRGQIFESFLARGNNISGGEVTFQLCPESLYWVEEGVIFHIGRTEFSLFLFFSNLRLIPFVKNECLFHCILVDFGLVFALSTPTDSERPPFHFSSFPQRYFQSMIILFFLSLSQNGNEGMILLASLTERKGRSWPWHDWSVVPCLECGGLK